MKKTKDTFDIAGYSYYSKVKSISDLHELYFSGCITCEEPVYFDLKTYSTIPLPTGTFADGCELTKSEIQAVCDEVYDHPDRYIELPHTPSGHDTYELMNEFAHTYCNKDSTIFSTLATALTDDRHHHPMSSFNKAIAELALKAEWAYFQEDAILAPLNNWLKENHIILPK